MDSENLSSYPTITMTREEFEKRWEAYHKARRQPKMIYQQGDKFIAGENISYGDLVYISSPTTIKEENK